MSHINTPSSQSNQNEQALSCGELREGKRLLVARCLRKLIDEEKLNEKALKGKFGRWVKHKDYVNSLGYTYRIASETPHDYAHSFRSLRLIKDKASIVLECNEQQLDIPLSPLSSYFNEDEQKILKLSGYNPIDGRNDFEIKDEELVTQGVCQINDLSIDETRELIRSLLGDDYLKFDVKRNFTPPW